MKEAVSSSNAIQVIDSIDGQGKSLFQVIQSSELEGVVGKRKGSLYKIGTRSKDWIKIRNWRDADCYIMGYQLDESGIFLGCFK